jgi:hypothetical protein
MRADGVGRSGAFTMRRSPDDAFNTDTPPDSYSACEKATGEDQFAVLDLAIATVEGEDAL